MVIVQWPVDAPRGAVTAFCAQHGISRSRFYEIRALGAEQGQVEAVLAPRRRSRPDLAIPAAVEAAALRIRKELAEDGWDHGPVSVRHRMLQAGLPAPSRATLARVFSRNGAVTAQPRKRPRSSWKRFTFPRVHECWQLDATEVKLADNSTAVVFQFMDDHSRYVVASLVAGSETSEAAVAVFKAGVKDHQVPVLILTDNGVAMNPHRRGKTSQLASYATSLGTKPITSRTYHPQTCGKNERIHSTLKKWLRARPAPATQEELTALVAVFDEQYNHHRPHQALTMRTPATALREAPRALPPLPPEPEPEPQPPTTTPEQRPCRPRRTRTQPPPARDQMRTLKVLASGSVKAGGVFINLGTEHARSHVLAIIEPPLISIFDAEGTELRTIHTTPGKIYYGTGRKGGGPRRTRLNTTIGQDEPTQSTVRPN